jgi:hypothetical protein
MEDALDIAYLSFTALLWLAVAGLAWGCERLRARGSRA